LIAMAVLAKIAVLPVLIALSALARLSNIDSSGSMPLVTRGEMVSMQGLLLQRFSAFLYTVLH